MPKEVHNYKKKDILLVKIAKVRRKATGQYSKKDHYEQRLIYVPLEFPDNLEEAVLISKKKAIEKGITREEYKEEDEYRIGTLREIKEEKEVKEQWKK